MFKIGDVVEFVKYPQKALDVVSVDEQRGFVTVKCQIYQTLWRIWPDAAVGR